MMQEEFHPFTVSELIKALQYFEGRYGGDIPVTVNYESDIREVYAYSAYDERGQRKSHKLEVMIAGHRKRVKD